MEMIRYIALEELAKLLQEQLGEGRKVRFCVRGASMQPSLQEGDIIEVEPTTAEKLQPGDVVVAWTEARDFFVHRLVAKAHEGTQWTLLLGPEAGRHLHQPLPETCVLGRVSCVERDGLTVNFFRRPPWQLRTKGWLLLRVWRWRKKLLRPFVYFARLFGQAKAND